MKTVGRRENDPKLLYPKKLERVARKLKSSVKAKYKLAELMDVNMQLHVKYDYGCDYNYDYDHDTHNPFLQIGSHRGSGSVRPKGRWGRGHPSRVPPTCLPDDQRKHEVQSHRVFERRMRGSKSGKVLGGCAE
jgi:hypothetical protein